MEVEVEMVMVTFISFSILIAHGEHACQDVNLSFFLSFLLTGPRHLSTDVSGARTFCPCRVVEVVSSDVCFVIVYGYSPCF